MLSSLIFLNKSTAKLTNTSNTILFSIRVRKPMAMQCNTHSVFHFSLSSPPLFAQNSLCLTHTKAIALTLQLEPTLPSLSTQPIATECGNTGRVSLYSTLCLSMRVIIKTISFTIELVNFLSLCQLI